MVGLTAIFGFLVMAVVTAVADAVFELAEGLAFLQLGGERSGQGADKVLRLNSKECNGYWLQIAGMLSRNQIN